MPSLRRDKRRSEFVKDPLAAWPSFLKGTRFKNEHISRYHGTADRSPLVPYIGTAAAGSGRVGCNAGPLWLLKTMSPKYPTLAPAASERMRITRRDNSTVDKTTQHSIYI